MKKLGIALVFATSGLVGCQTNFVGDPQFPGGARGCWDRCASLDMEMASFVFVGEYSSACACRPRVVGGPGTAAVTNGTQAAIVAATAGVELQRRRNEQERQRNAQVLGPP